MPDNLSFRLDRQTALQERISIAQRRKADILEQKERLIAVFKSTGTLATVDEDNLSPEQRQLRQLQRDLDAALVVYSETNPKVVLLKTRIDQLSAAVAAQTSGAPSGDSSGPSLMEIELGRIDAEVATLDASIEEAEAELSVVSDSINRTPANAIALSALERDYQNVQTQYNAAVSRLAQAQTGERIELLSKGERVTVIEQATVPSSPTSPNRPRIAQAGVAAGFAIAAGLFLLLELLNTAIRRPAELTKSLGITPFAVMPYMNTTGESRRRKFVWVALFAGAIALIIGTLAAIQTFYLPLDLVFEKVFNKLGLSDLVFW